jgi:hypothetical protein
LAHVASVVSSPSFLSSDTGYASYHFFLTVLNLIFSVLLDVRVHVLARRFWWFCVSVFGLFWLFAAVLWEKGEPFGSAAQGEAL